MNSVTPQRKLIANTDKFNNAGIKKQQGTTRAIYDSLPLDGRTNFRFFEESNNRNFPLTNTGADGNKKRFSDRTRVFFYCYDHRRRSYYYRRFAVSCWRSRRWRTFYWDCKFSGNETSAAFVFWSKV